MALALPSEYSNKLRVTTLAVWSKKNRRRLSASHSLAHTSASMYHAPGTEKAEGQP